nr:hypothetical protein [Actinomycetota bacterium]
MAVGRQAFVVLAASFLLAGGAGTPARAATVGSYYNGARFEVLDDLAERNDLVVTLAQKGDTVLVEEFGPSALLAGDGCRKRSSRVVECNAKKEYGAPVRIDAGRADDRVRIRDPFAVHAVSVRGGAGDDHLDIVRGGGRLYGESGRDFLSGASGRDALYGGPGRDRLLADAGNDYLNGDAVDANNETGPSISADFIDGGPGGDIVAWGNRRGGHVNVDLASGRRAGAPGEDDRLDAIENVVGTAGRDRLAGDGRSNRLFGRGGRDLLIGRGGSDRLDGGLAGWAYNGAPDGVADRYLCGRGTDLVVDPELDPLLPGCERLDTSIRLHLDGQTIRVQPRPLRGNRYGFEAICSLQSLKCRRRIVLVHRGRVVAKSRVVTTEDQRVLLVVKTPRP